MYLHARAWDIQPSEFWEMTLPEWFAEYDFHAGKKPGDFAGNLTQGDVDDIEDWLVDQAEKDLENGHAKD